MKFYNYINEKTFAIGQDVDLIYKKFFKKWIDLYNKNFEKFKKEMKKEQSNGKEVIFGEIYGKDLKSKISQKADNIRPVLIRCGVLKDGNKYNLEYGVISVSFNISAIYMLLQFGKNISLGSDEERRRFNNEMSPSTIKSTIYHELSHWLNDTLHNQSIKKELHQRMRKKSLSDINFGFTELDAQVHAIKQLKRDYKKEWDFLTWTDIYIKKGAFYVLFKQLLSKDKKFIENYRRKLMARLNREKLLGKKMKNSFYDALKYIQ